MDLIKPIALLLRQQVVEVEITTGFKAVSTNASIDWMKGKKNDKWIEKAQELGLDQMSCKELLR